VPELAIADGPDPPAMARSGARTQRPGVEPGTTYPGPIIDHRAGRERALKANAKVRAM